MTGIEIAIVALLALLVLLILNVPIGISFLVVSFSGMWALRGTGSAIGLIKSVPFEFVSHWGLSAIPMFLLMGSLAGRSGISESLFKAGRLWLGGLPGGLAIATNWASAAFAAASGSSVATAAAMGRLAIPEMMDHGYKGSFATGVVASAGTLGALIPPSILFILFGIFAEESIVKLLIAGLLPGLLTAFAYSAVILLLAWKWPDLAPRVAIRPTFSEKIRSIGPVWPMAVIVVGIAAALYSGVVTATEAGAFGAALTLVMVIVQRRLTGRLLIDSIVEATRTSANIFLIAMGASMFANFLAVSGLPFWLSDHLVALGPSPVQLVLIAVVTYFILGMFLDPLGILLLTLPVLIPILDRLDIDMIWFGVLTVKMIEIGLMTPPVGLNVYTVKSVVGTKVSLGQIFWGTSWFLIAEIVVMTLLIAFPSISTWLPSQMN